MDNASESETPTTTFPLAAAMIAVKPPQPLNQIESIWLDQRGGNVMTTGTDGWIAQDRILAGRCLMPVMLYPSADLVHQALTVAALIDTGAMTTSVSHKLAEFVGLKSSSGEIVTVATSFAPHQQVSPYVGQLEILKPGAIGAATRIVDVRLLPLLHPVGASHLVIGMDIIGHARKFLIENGIWTLEF